MTPDTAAPSSADEETRRYEAIQDEEERAALDDWLHVNEPRWRGGKDPSGDEGW